LNKRLWPQPPFSRLKTFSKFLNKAGPIKLVYHSTYFNIVILQITPLLKNNSKFRHPSAFYSSNVIISRQNNVIFLPQGQSKCYFSLYGVPLLLRLPETTTLFLEHSLPQYYSLNRACLITPQGKVSLPRNWNLRVMSYLSNFIEI
jgi:hypothetical protein